MEFEVIGTISDIEIIAVGKSIREIGRLRRAYGSEPCDGKTHRRNSCSV